MAAAADRSEVQSSNALSDIFTTNVGDSDEINSSCESDCLAAGRALSRRCKTLVEIDRNMHAEESAGYQTDLFRMHGLDGYSKIDLLVGRLLPDLGQSL